MKFRYENEKDTTPQFGLIAEDVAKINRDLVVRDEKGEIYSARYDAANAMLLRRVDGCKSRACRKKLPLFEIALMFERLDHVASLVEHANHGIM